MDEKSRPPELVTILTRTMETIQDATVVPRNGKQVSEHDLDNTHTMSLDNERSFPTRPHLLQSYFPSILRSSTEPELNDLTTSPPVSGRKPKGLAWKEIQNLRANVWDLRSQIHQIRASLREKQNVKATAEDILFRRITYMTARGLSLTEPSNSSFPGQKSLAQLMSDFQEARNEYGPLEDDCTQLEDQLSRQEFKLAQLEDGFFAQLSPNQQAGRLSQTALQSPSASEVGDDDSENNSEYHPLVVEYLSKLGDLDLLQERLDESRDEKKTLEAEKISRQRFGLNLDPVDQDWLDHADEEYGEITSKLSSLEREVERLKQNCLSMNLIDADGEPTRLQPQEDPYFVGEEDIDSQSRKSEYVKYPVLLPYYPRKKCENNENFNPGPDLESDTTTTRINKWILDKLRISPLDVWLLASTFELMHGRIFKDWQVYVLKVWYEEDTSRILLSQERRTSPSHSSSMSTKHPDETSLSSNLSQEHLRGAPILSNRTERVFGLNRSPLAGGIFNHRNSQAELAHDGPLSQ